MPLFDPLLVPSLLILAAGASPPCSPHKPPQINVIPQTADIRYDHSQSLAALQRYKSDTVSPYDVTRETRTQGLMNGSLTVEPAVRIQYEIEQNRQIACLWYEKIDIPFRLAPTIMLAREVYADSCMRKAVTEHEMKHVNLDRVLVNKYARIIGEKILNRMNQKGFSVGPVPASEAKGNSIRMQEEVFRAVDAEFKALSAEQMREQQKIDSLAEYERVNHLCPGFKLPSQERPRTRRD